MLEAAAHGAAAQQQVEHCALAAAYLPVRCRPEHFLAAAAGQQWAESALDPVGRVGSPVAALKVAVLARAGSEVQAARSFHSAHLACQAARAGCFDPAGAGFRLPMGDPVDAAHSVAHSLAAQCLLGCLVEAAAEHCAQGLPDCSAGSPPGAQDPWGAERDWAEVHSGSDEELLQVVPREQALRSEEADCRAALAHRVALPLDSDEARSGWVLAPHRAVRERVRYSREHCYEPEQAALPVPLWRAIALQSGYPTAGQAFSPVVPAWLRTEPVLAVVQSLQKLDARCLRGRERVHALPPGRRARSCGPVRREEPFRLCRFGLHFPEPLLPLATRVASSP